MLMEEGESRLGKLFRAGALMDPGTQGALESRESEVTAHVGRVSFQLLPRLPL